MKDLQDRGDLFHPASFRDELQHLALARGQLRGARPTPAMPRDDALRQRRRQVVAPLQDLWMAFTSSSPADCLSDNLEAPGRMASVTTGSGVYGEQDDSRITPATLSAPQGVHPAHARHRNVGDDDSGFSDRLVHQPVSIADGTDDVEPVFQQGHEAVHDDRVIVGDEDSRESHTGFATCGVGTYSAPIRSRPTDPPSQAVTVERDRHARSLARVDSTLAVPLLNRTRSSMLRNPAHSGVPAGFEPDAVVDDLELDRRPPFAPVGRGRRCARMPARVRERLLSHPVDAQRGGAIDRADALVGTEGDIDLLLSRELVTVGLQDRDEASVIEDTRMQVVGKVPDVGDERGCALLKRGHYLFDVRSAELTRSGDA